MSPGGRTLERLAARRRIAAEYHAVDGTPRRVPEATQRRLLEAMGVACGDPAEAERSLAEIEVAAWRRRLPPVVVARDGEASFAVELTWPDDDREAALEWQLDEESGHAGSGALDARSLHALERRQLDGRAWLRATLTLPAPSAIGYHRLTLRRAGAAQPLAECLVVAAPRRCYRPDALTGDGRLWGLTAQLYALRSRRNWGIGDFTDLLRLLELAAENGAAFVGLNPLHAPHSYDGTGASPYSPTSRRFLNPLYLDVETIQDFEECDEARELVMQGEFQAALRSLRAAELIDYAAVAEAKLRVLERTFASFCRRHRDAATQRGRAFQSFKREHAALRDYTAFHVVREYLRASDPEAWQWQNWPEPYRDKGSQAVAELLAARPDRVDFFAWLQWNAHLQLASAARRASELGLDLGLYTDLALGVTDGGADTWSEPALYVTGAHIGAPPDDFNEAGQDWGLPPWDPERMRAAGYGPLIETLRANMQLGGALRIDHVMSLYRCFLIPHGASPAEGAYLLYRFDEMLAILALESRRNRCVVIGEDLGTVLDEVRHGLIEAGALGYRVLFFEKDGHGAFKAPEHLDTEVLTVVSTHDLPTLAGFWHGTDIEWRTALDLYPTPEQRERQVVMRAQDRAKLLVALEQQDLLPPPVGNDEASAGAAMTPELSSALHAYVARSRSRLVGLQVEDLLGQREQPNLPGTTSGHPNWRRRLPLQLESWNREPGVEGLLATMRRERPGRAARPEPRGAPGTRGAAARARIPRATYRLQLHAGFGFSAAADLVPYLDALGISHCYCSPYLKARPGSLHGYDIVDHNELNPEIGGRAELDRFCDTLAEHGMAHILDVVPNHMAVMGRDNAWWLDLLEGGPASEYAPFFDIDWQPLKEELRGKVLLPILGDHYGNVLDRGELVLGFDAAEGSFAVDYYEHRFPVDPREYPRILEPGLEQLRQRWSADDAALVQFESLITAFGNLPVRTRTDDDSRRERARDQALHKRRLAELVEQASDIRLYVDETLRAYNGDERHPADSARLHDLLEAQAYRLAYWRVAPHDINYRRFFDINELASLRMENAEVFEAAHSLVFELVESGRVAGLRIDHPDGLYDPRAYFRRLQERFGRPQTGADERRDLPLYVVAEKILAGDEELRGDWPVHGTSGYDFANLVGRLLVDPEGVAELGRVYTAFVGTPQRYPQVVRTSKQLIMQTALASELNVLAAELDRIAERDLHTRDFDLGGLHAALLETIACFPVYRTYIVGGETAPADEHAIHHAVDTAKRLSRAADTAVFEFVRDVLLNRHAIGRDAQMRDRVARFVMQLQQYTGAVAAKGVEDTAFYRHARLVSLNEVGGTPERPAVSVAEFHAANEKRGESWPHSLLGSSTHDTKRSEDVRARINVLSEIPSEWEKLVEQWSRANERFRQRGSNGDSVPDRDTEYFLYQTLLGVWPLEDTSGQTHAELVERVTAYMTKAAREAKTHTSWINQDPEYEAALTAFTAALLEPPGSSAFVETFIPFKRRVARLGLYNSLVQVLLKLTCPGVPDIYQGNELWRFDLVDPDNRRPVDYAHRRELLAALREAFAGPERDGLARRLLATIEDGRIKLLVTWRGLEARREQPELFERGRYEPIAVTGTHAGRICAFARRTRDATLVVAAPTRWTPFAADDGHTFDPARLEDTTIELPGDAPLINRLTGDVVAAHRTSGPLRVRAADLFAQLPAALLL